MEQHFSELALAALRRLIPEADRQLPAMRVIVWKLSKEDREFSRPSPSHPGLRIDRLFVGVPIRVLYDDRPDFMIWSISAIDDPTE